MANKRKQQQTASQARDWALFGLRLLYLVALSGFLYWLAYTNNTATLNTFFLPVALSLIANLVLLLFILIPAIHPHAGWVIMIADWVTIGMFTTLTYRDPLLATILLSLFFAVSVTRLGARLGIIDMIGGIVVFLGVIYYQRGLSYFQQTQQIISILTPVSVGVLVASGLAILSHFEERVFEDRHAKLTSQAEENLILLQDMQERTTVITEMAQMLSSTLNYQRVLDAALGVGRLAMSSGSVESNSFSSVVMLYRAEDRQLYTITGLSMARQDRGRVTSGRGGIVREALTLCEPVFGGHIRKDPELSDFVTLRSARSVVVVPLRAGYDNYGVMIFASRVPNAFKSEYKVYLQAIGIQTTIALQNAALYQNLLEEKERIVEVEKEARKKLARDLHDGPTQTISAIAMRMSIIRMMLERTPDEVPDELKKIEELALQTTSEIRLMLYTLRPLALESEGGLPSALEQLADKFEAVYEQRVDVMVSQRAEQMLTEAQSETVFSIVQETVNNARKHAEADLINVRVTTYDDTVMLEIADDGKGFDVEKQRAAARDRNSLGMQNLHDLVELLDGTLTIDSVIGQGTNITILIPIDPAGLNGRRKPKPKPKPGKERFKLAAMR